MSIVTADDLQRIRIPDARPGQSFAYELAGNVVKLTPIKQDVEDVPVVKLVQRPDGSLRFPDNAKPGRKAIRDAIRADRDSR